MAQLKDILDLESKREERNDYESIHLFPEGTFYRAYEWSAWLCCRYVNEFKVTRRENKNLTNGDGTVAFIGFPITSLKKFTPEGCEITANEDKSITVTLPFGVFGDNANHESLATDFANWKQSIPIAVSKKGGSLRDSLKNGDQEMQQGRHMSDVVFRIMSYPIEQKSPLECMSFLAELKHQLANFL